MQINECERSHDRGSSPRPTSIKTNRREVLLALGVGMTAPLFGCGGGGGGGAAASAPSTPPPPPPPPPLDITPTVTFDANATSGLTTNYAYLTGSSAVNPAFTFSGAAPSLITQLGTAIPRYNMVSAAASNADTIRARHGVHDLLSHRHDARYHAIRIQRQRHRLHQRHFRCALRPGVASREPRKAAVQAPSPWRPPHRPSPAITTNTTYELPAGPACSTRQNK